MERAGTIGAVDRGFLPALEGMRALAVVCVLLYHLWPESLPGGFIGVDLFFVISGFIITRNIVLSAEQGDFTLGGFYRRRFHRLAPALLATLAVSLLAGWLLLPPAELAALGRSALYAALAVANFGFWLDAGYFDALAHTKPLLHTWSLGVEEQFYVLWPALLLLAMRGRWLLPLVVIALLGSAGLSLAIQADSPDAVFYLLPFRAQQLAAGALLAVTGWHLGERAGGLALLLGTSGVVACALLLDGQAPPGNTAILVTFCSVLLLLGRHSTPGHRLLGAEPLQWLGQRSYALYLVHWPLIVYAGFALDFQLSNGVLLGLAVASVVMAAALYALVETPLRLRGGEVGAASATGGIAAALLLVVFAASNLWGYAGFPARSAPEIAQLLSGVPQETQLRRNSIRFGSCMLHSTHSLDDYDDARCAQPVPDKTNILIIGDSTAADVYLMLAQQPSPNTNLLQATATGCPALVTLRGGEHATCRAFNEKRFTELLRDGVDLVLLASNWRDEDLVALKATVSAVQSEGVPVAVVGPRVKFDRSIVLFVSRQASLEGINEAAASLVDRQRALRSAMAQGLEGVPVLDLETVQCAPECLVVGPNGLLYLDNIHLTWAGARLFGRRLLRQIAVDDVIAAAQRAATSVSSSSDR